MNNLLQLTLEAHGGLERWKKFKKVGLHMMVSGVLWPLKRQDNVLSDSRIEVELHRQGGRYINFESNLCRETYFDPKRVAIIDKGQLVQELVNPRDSFNGHTLETPWTKLQLVYFGTYAMWEYLTIPFNFTMPGFDSKEIEPWYDGNEKWRRLQVSFPDDLAFHSKEQVFYFDEKGFLKRMDYDVEISGNIPAAQYVFEYRNFQGIKLPTKRLVYGRDERGQSLPDQLVVGIELLKVQFT